jgi:type IV secretory pathway component VirB8
VLLYQRQTERKIKILSSQKLEREKPPFSMQVVYEATLRDIASNKSDKPERFQADVAFTYENIKLDEKTGTVEPYRFQVTDYRTKRL